MLNPNCPRPPFVPGLLDLTDPEAEPDERPTPLMVPDPDLADWVLETLLGEDSPLLVTDHVEILSASVGFLWTNVERKRSGGQVLGTAQLGKPTRHHGDAWTVAGLEQQRREWFGKVPDLLVTLYAPFFARCDEVAVVAVIDHELRHFAPKVDKEGEPAYDEETGRPAWRIVSHDLEEFTGTIEHFGAGWDGARERMRQAMALRPRFDVDLVSRFVGPPLL